MKRGAILFCSLVLGGFGASLLGGCASAPRAVPTARLGLIDHLRRLEEVGGKDYFKKDQDLPPQADSKTVSKVRSLASSWKWPLKEVQITSPFGRRGEEFHEGIDLRAPQGTPVYAAEAGTVLYAGSGIIGYGRMVILKHESGLASVYAHNSKIFVKRGQRVKQGQKLASSGKSGRATGAHLHFEVRDGTVALDPMAVLPKNALAAGEGAAKSVSAADRGGATPRESATKQASTGKSTPRKKSVSGATTLLTSKKLATRQ